MPRHFRLTALCLVLLASCAHAVPPLEPPSRAVLAERAFVSDRKPTPAETFSYTPIEGSYFGVSGANGSALAGLLLGPIGVAGNILYMDAANRESGSQVIRLAAVNLADVLAGAVPELPRSAPDGDERFELAPAASLNFSSGGSYRVVCILNASLREQRWAASYVKEIDADFDPASASDTDKAIASLDSCLRDAHRLFREHVSGALAPFAARDVSYYSWSGDHLDLPTQVSQSALPGRVITSNTRVVQEIPPNRVLSIR